MLHGRALWVAAILGFVVLGSALGRMGPFGAHSTISYPRFLADFEDGRVGRVVQWQDRLEITEGDQLLLVTIPADADVQADLAMARITGGVGIDYSVLEDDWASSRIPVVPILLLIAGLLLWLPAVLRARTAVQGIVPDAPMGA